MRASYDQGRTAARAAVESRAPEPAVDHDPTERATVLVDNATRHHALIAARCAAMTDAASAEDWDAAHDDAQRGLGELRALCRRSALAQRADGAGADAPRAEAARAAGGLLAAAEQAVASAAPRPARAGAAFARTDEVVACFARAGESSARDGFAQAEQQFRALLPTFSAVELRQLRDATRDPDHPVARALATVTPERRARMSDALFSPKLAFAATARDAMATRVGAVAAELGAPLGVAPTVVAGEAARAGTEREGALGLAHGDRIEIHPDVDPDSRDGRAVIAHEVVHVAQAGLADDEGEREDAEDEAASLASQAAAGAVLARPRVAIDLAHPAADNGRRRARADASAPRSRVIEPTGPISTAAREVVDARDALHVAAQLGRPIEAPLAQLDQAIDGLADVLHRNAGARSADDDRAIEIALEAAGGAANLLASRSGPHSRAEHDVRRRVTRVREAAREGQARDATLESSTEVARMIDESLGELRRVRGVAGALVSAIDGLTVEDLRGVDRALAETAAWREEIAASPKAAERLARAAIDQQALLVDAVAELSAALGQPVTFSTAAVVRAYLDAIASSTERKATSAPRLEYARRLRQRLPLDRTEGVLADSYASTRMIEVMDPDAGISARRKQTALAKRHRELDAQVVGGKRVSSDEIEGLVVDTREFEFLRRLDVLRLQAQGAYQAIDAVRANHTVETVRAQRKLDDLRAMLAGLRGQYNVWVESLTGDAVTDAEIHAAKRAALDGMEQRLARYLKDEQYEATMRAAQRVIEDEQSQRILESLVITVVLTIAGNFLAAAVRGAAEGAYLARAGVAAENGALSLRAGLTAERVGQVAGMAADTGWNAVTQKYLMGDDVSLASLLALNVVTAASVDRVIAIGRTPARMGDVEQQVMGSSRWAKARGAAGLVLAEGVTMSAEMITGAAVDYAMRRALDERAVAPTEQQVSEWLVQGASIALGRHLSQRVEAITSRIQRIEHWSRARTTELSGHVVEVKALARKLEKGADPEGADDALRRYAALLDAEHALLEEAMLAQVDHGEGPLGHEQLKALLRANNRAAADIARIGADEGVAQSGGEAPARSPRRSGGRDRGRGRDDDATSRAGDEDPAKRAAPDADEDTTPVARGEDAASDARDAHDAPASRVTTAAMVPGSEFRGARSARDPAAVLASADSVFASAMRAVGPVQRIEPGLARHTFVVTVPPGHSFSVRVMTAPLAQSMVARTVLNTTKRGVSTVQRGGGDAAATTHDVMVEGRFVIQLSDGLDPAHVERALVHETREILAERELAANDVGARADSLMQGPLRPDAVLSPHDLGRLAELNYLATTARDATRAESAQREVLALIDHLGLREGTPGADERRLLVHDHLSEPARRALDGLRGDAEHLPTEAAGQLARVREVAAADATARAGEEAYRAPLHAMPDARTAGSRATATERHALATQAAAARAERSRRTVAALRAEAAALPAGQYPTVDDPMVGAGASLAARRPEQLLVDDRGRWQADASERIAQTAQQLGALVDAGFGDPFQFAGATERVPMEAVRYWEDTIAAQGPVIDGRGTLKHAADGKVLLEVMPTEGPPPITLEVRGIPVQSSGFPPERVPGMAFGETPTQALAHLDTALATITSDPEHPQHAQATEARARLRALSGAGKGDAALAAQTLAAYPALRDVLTRSGGRHAERAAQTLDAYGAWDALRSRDLADGTQRVFMGDEANLTTFDPLSSDSWVIAGTGGTGISAAEIILDKNPKAHVTMVGVDQPAGLMENDQARRLFTRYGDAATVPEGTPPGDGRFHLKSGVRVDAPKETMVNGERRYEVWSDPTTGESIHGESYIAAIGREGELPPAVIEMARAAYQRDPDSVTAEPRFDADRQYLGYRLTVKSASGANQQIDITGAASRYAPPAWVAGSGLVKDAIDEARDVDAPAESGNFDGGFVSSATQAARYGRLRRAELSRGKARTQ